MGYPQNPDTIILKNKFYPSGLKEIDVWNYYQSMKVPLLKETMGKNLMFAIMVNINKPILRRKTKTGIIQLTPKNYDEMITGRTIAIYSEMKAIENFAVIDIDISPSDGFSWAKDAAMNVYDYVIDKMPLVRTASIRFTGKTSFHIVCNFGRKMKVDAVRYLMERFLRESDLSKIYTIEAKRRPGVPNLDLSINKFRGAYITLNSLSILGLKCMEVSYMKLKQFVPKNAKI